MATTIRFLKDHGLMKTGEVADVGDSFAAKLVWQRIAERVVAVPTPATANEAAARILETASVITNDERAAFVRAVVAAQPKGRAHKVAIKDSK
jgi:hypothetical protein